MATTQRHVCRVTNGKFKFYFFVHPDDYIKHCILFLDYQRLFYNLIKSFLESQFVKSRYLEFKKYHIFVCIFFNSMLSQREWNNTFYSKILPGEFSPLTY